MLSRRILFPFAAAVVFFVLGVALRNLNLMLLAVPGTVLIIIAALRGEDEANLEVRRKVGTDRLVEGDEVSVTLTVRNRGETLEHLRVEDVIPPASVLVDGSRAWVGRLEAGETATLRYRLRFEEPGKYAFRKVKTRAGWHLNLFQAAGGLPLKSVVTVMPEVHDSRRAKLEPTKVRQRPGTIVARRSGIGSEFYGIREHHQGDDLRKVNWRATARTGKLHVNQSHGERSGDTVIVVDARSVSDVNRGRDSMTNWCVRGAATVASMVLRERNRVGLLVQRDVVDWIYPGYGKRQLHRVMEALLSAREGGRWEFSQITWVVSRFFPTHSQVILVSPLADPHAFQGVVSLRSKGYDVLVISPSPVSTPGVKGLKGGTGRIARKLMKLERETDIRWLSRYVRVIDWDTEVPLESYLRKGRLRM